MVIVIIAILAALLLPVLSKAKESAKDIGCIFNMKEIGVAMAHYNLDNHEACLNDMEGEYEMPFVGAWRLLGPYIATNQTSFYLCPADNPKDEWNVQNASIRALINPRLLLWPSSYYPHLSFCNPMNMASQGAGGEDWRWWRELLWRRSKLRPVSPWANPMAWNSYAFELHGLISGLDRLSTVPADHQNAS